MDHDPNQDRPAKYKVGRVEFSIFEQINEFESEQTNVIITSTSGNIKAREARAFAEASIIFRALQGGLANRSVPPGRWLVADLCLRPAVAEDVYANMQDVYPRWEAAHGPRKARFLWYWNVSAVILGRFASPFVKVVRALI